MLRRADWRGLRRFAPHCQSAHHCAARIKIHFIFGAEVAFDAQSLDVRPRPVSTAALLPLERPTVLQRLRAVLGSVISALSHASIAGVDSADALARLGRVVIGSPLVTRDDADVAAALDEAHFKHVCACPPMCDANTHPAWRHGTALAWPVAAIVTGLVLRVQQSRLRPLWLIGCALMGVGALLRTHFAYTQSTAMCAAASLVASLEAAVGVASAGVHVVRRVELSGRGYGLAAHVPAARIEARHGAIHALVLRRALRHCMHALLRCLRHGTGRLVGAHPLLPYLDDPHHYLSFIETTDLGTVYGAL